MAIDGRQQEIAQEVAAGEAQHPTYEAPRLVQLGQSKDLIRGNAYISNWDHIQNNFQWYQSGE